MGAIIVKLFPIIPAFALTTGSSTMDKFIQWFAGIAAAIIAVFLIMTLINESKDAALGNGSGSFWKTLKKIGFFILMIGLVVFAVQYKKIGNTTEKFGNGALNVIETETTSFLP